MGPFTILRITSLIRLRVEKIAASTFLKNCLGGLCSVINASCVVDSREIEKGNTETAEKEPICFMFTRSIPLPSILYSLLSTLHQTWPDTLFHQASRMQKGRSQLELIRAYRIRKTQYPISLEWVVSQFRSQGFLFVVPQSDIQSDTDTFIGSAESIHPGPVG